MISELEIGIAQLFTLIGLIISGAKYTITQNYDQYIVYVERTL